MLIFKRGNKLYLEFFDINKNKTVQKSTRLNDTVENRLHIEKAIIPNLEKALKVKTSSAPQIKSLEYYINRYLRTKENLATYDEIESKTKVILKYFTEEKELTDIKAVKPTDCEDFIYGLKLKTSTKSNYKDALKGIFDEACKDLTIDNNPTRFIKLIRSEKELESDDIDPFTKKEVDMLLNEATGILKLFLGVSFYSGARSGEILGLKIQDIDFENKTISFNKQFTKGKLKNSLKTKGSKRYIPLFNPAIPYFKALIERAKSNRSFYLFSKGKEPNNLYSIDNIRGKKPYGSWSKLLIACNLEYRKIYQTRHTFAVHMLSSGALTASEVAQTLGHTNTKTMFESYAKHIKGEQLKVSRNIDIFDTTDSFTDTDTFYKKIN